MVESKIEVVMRLIALVAKSTIFVFKYPIEIFVMWPDICEELVEIVTKVLGHF